MQFPKPFSAICFFAIFAMSLAMAALVTQPAQAQTFKVVHTFEGGPEDGWFPASALLVDPVGNLYGTTEGGGSSKGICPGGCGTAFKMNNSGVPTWVHTFKLSEGFGSAAGLLRDANRDLFGTTFYGGKTTCSTLGCGTVFELNKLGEQTLLYKFAGPPDGWLPNSSLVEDASGNLYGTTETGGTAAAGTIFKVTQAGKETVLYSFTGGADGCSPMGVILDSAGDLYGVASQGGDGVCQNGDGVVFELDTTGDLAVLHTFGGPDGAGPSSVLLMDSSGNLYGTTAEGGSSTACTFGCGTVFELTPDGTETVLYNFCSLTNCVDGEYPLAGPLIMDSTGNLYGTTLLGGTYRSSCEGGSCGVAFELTAAGNETVLHSFSGKADGGLPTAGLVMDSSGNLYGTAEMGGDLRCQSREGGCGVVFEITP
jgi:uncharacterized repeat protein (TIGR03803 family)